MKVGALGHLFSAVARKYAEQKAVSFLRHGKVENVLSYQQLEYESNRMANGLLDLNIEKGDRIILFMPKSLFSVVFFLASYKIGAIGVPLNPGFKKSEMSYLLGDVDARLVITGSQQESIIKDLDPKVRTIQVQTEKSYENHPSFRSATDTLPPTKIEPEDPGLIIYTSGTTGKPKGAVLTHQNLIHDAKNIIRVWEITESDVLCHTLPLFHVHGLCFALHTALLAGAHAVMLDEFRPDKVIEALARKEGEYAPTLFMAVPSMYTKIMDDVGEDPKDFSHVRLWTSGSAPLPVRDFERIKKVFGKEPVEREGMSETGMNFSNPMKGIRKPGTIGLPLPDLEVRIVDPETWEDVEPGQIGEVWLKGPGITPGYWRKPQETSEAFRHGWFRTGDLGKVDVDGYYSLTDRLKHIIISGGENISPVEVERVINSHEAVRESAVVGIPDEEWGEKVVAAVATKPGDKLRAEDIIRFCRDHLHNWKCPKEIFFLSELPRNTMGKIMKEKLRKLFD